MITEKLMAIIENHKHRFNEDCDGWEEMKADLRGVNLYRSSLYGADLRGADLRGANLYGSNLHGADLFGADLRGANLYGADLRRANLYGTNLHGADLCGADLRGVDLSEANLYGADLRRANLYGSNLHGADLFGADLRGANLYGADLRRANLYGTNLHGADLCGADLRGVDLSEANLTNANLTDANFYGAKNIPYIPYSCPDTGSFIGYKKADGRIVKLEILYDARRCSATGRKCRCDKAKVLSIQNLDGSESKIKCVRSTYDPRFVYTVGKIVEEPEFCEDRWRECAKGIHFFINRQEAVEY